MAKDRLFGKKTLHIGGFLDEFEKDDIKRKVDIVRLFEHFGVRLVKKGKSYTGICPWHDDKTPSLSVDKEKGLYNCFGCGESGDHFSLVMKMKGVEFKQALTFLKGMAGKVNIPPSRSVAKKKETTTGTELATRRKKPGTELPGTGQEKKSPPVNMGAEKQEQPPTQANISLDIVCDYYHKKLYENRQAMDYLTNTRKINTGLILRFKIGFADGSLMTIISNGQKEACKALGILKTTDKGRVWEFFAGCLTFPITDEPGTTVHLYGRKADHAAKHPHLYLSGSHKSVFNRKASRVYDTIIIVESILDCLSLITIGFENVQPLYGVGTLTAEHLQILKDDRVKVIILALDNDDAGRKGCETHKQTFLDKGFSVKEIIPPEGKDWNDCLLAGINKQDVLKLIEEAEVSRPETGDTGFKVEKIGLSYVFLMKEMKYTLYGVNELFIQHLKVNIKAGYRGKTWTDNCDLCSAKSRGSFAVNLASRFEMEDVVIENDLNKILGYFENKRDLRFAGAGEKKKVDLSETEKKLGMDLLCDKNVFDTILSHARKLGYAGQEENVLILFIVGISRFQKEPLSIYLTGESSSGKTAIVRLLEKMTLKEDIWKANSISPEVLYYVEEKKYKGKIFLMGESTHDEKVEGIVRQMQSDGEIAKLVTQKNEQSGAMSAEYIQKKVQMSFIITTTKVGINPENLSRCLVLTLDEDKHQISEAQAMIGLKHAFEKEKAGMEEELIIRQHYAAQYLLEPVKVFNIFGKLTRFPSSRPTLKRAFDHFLYFTDSICYFRQKQKPWVTREIPGLDKKVRGKKCDMYDYEIAYRLYVQRVLRRTGLTDIASSTRGVYEKIRQMTRKEAGKKGLNPREIRFMQRDLREFTGLRHEFVKKHLRLLLSYEYIIAVSGKSRGTRNVYRLRDDVDMIELDISMITTPEEMKNIYEEADRKEKELFREEEEWD
jgi:5S rRNA maturation endonuclease (ribonuclease M5)